MNEILSVGIDIGTSTTQTVFSLLTLQNTAGYFAVPRIAIVDKKTVYKGPIHLTPMKSRTLLDASEIKKLVAADFADAGYSPKDTATGAVIITGESARKENAAAVLEELAGFAGEFVVSTAGPDLEAVIAGKGSGAWQYSVDNVCTAANLDIGGGTTNIVLFSAGETIETGCLDIGGRQIRIDADKNVIYVSPSARIIANYLKLPIEETQKADMGTLKAICSKMAELLEDSIAGRDSELLRAVATSGSSRYEAVAKPDAVFFSGGVADCIYRGTEDDFAYGDIGVLLGRAIRERRFFSDYSVQRGSETIRATVVGAGSYTTMLSGSTIFYSSPLFPQKNVAALRLSYAEQELLANGDAAGLREKIAWFLKETDRDNLLLAFPGEENPDYDKVKRLAKAVAEAADRALPEGVPVLLAVERDIAKALGQAVYNALARRREVVSIDSVRLDQGDYVDLGKPLMDGLAVPVVVKSLIFG
jgi:ethanolamine utilization protein EutA